MMNDDNDDCKDYGEECNEIKYKKNKKTCEDNVMKVKLIFFLYSKCFRRFAYE